MRLQKWSASFSSTINCEWFLSVLLLSSPAKRLINTLTVFHMTWFYLTFLEHYNRPALFCYARSSSAETEFQTNNILLSINALEHSEFNYDLVPVTPGASLWALQLDVTRVYCKILFTSAFRCRFVSFSRLVAKSCVHMWVCFKPKQSSSKFKCRYGSFLKLDVRRQPKKWDIDNGSELGMKTCGVNPTQIMSPVSQEGRGLMFKL